MPTRRSDVFAISGALTSIDLAIKCTTSRALTLAVEAHPAAESLLGEVSARRLQQAALLAIAHAAPAIVAVTLSDTTYGALRGELRLAIAPPSIPPPELRRDAGARTAVHERRAETWGAAACSAAAEVAASAVGYVAGNDGVFRAAAEDDPLAAPHQLEASLRYMPYSDSDLLSTDRASAAAPARTARQAALAAAAAGGGAKSAASTGRRSARSDLYGGNVLAATADATARKLRVPLPRADDVKHEERLRIAFSAVDVGGLGKIGKRELYDALRRVGVTGSSNQMLAIFKEAHEDVSSQEPLTWTEWRALGFRLPQLAHLGQGPPAEQLAADQINLAIQSKTQPQRAADEHLRRLERAQARLRG